MAFGYIYRKRGVLRALSAVLVLLLVLVLAAWALRWLQDWRVALAVLAAAVLLSLVVARARRWVPRRTILEVDFERGVVEAASPSAPFASGGGTRPLVLRDVLDLLERAGDDKRVVGLLARVGSFRPGIAVAQELRAAILAFRAKGKRAVAWAETLGEGRSATVEVYFASAFDQVHVQPGGEVGLDGVLMRQPFLKGAFDKVGVEPQMGHRREYKTAMYMFTERSMNEPHRESYQSLLDSLSAQLVTGIATGRGLDETVVRELVDRGPFHANEAVDAGLIDRLSYRDEVYASLKEELKGTYLYVDRYLRRAGRPQRKGATIALIHGVGAIARGRSRSTSLFGGATMGSDDIAAAFRKAVKAKRVKAILFRVDSPGGSAVASDTIWREVRRAREQGTPVVVSMGNVAGSGGYYVAMGADKIVAEPGTITGSIGVVWGKFVTKEAWAKLGVDWDSLQFGENADIWSPGHELDAGGWKRLESFLDAVYDEFTAKVAEGRGLDRETVEAVAKGRVWTGEQASRNGLVDEVGGFARALELAREAADLPVDAPVKLRPFGRRRRFLDALRSEESSEAAARMLAPLAEAVGALGVVRPPGPLAVPPFELSTDATEP